MAGSRFFESVILPRELSLRAFRSGARREWGVSSKLEAPGALLPNAMQTGGRERARRARLVARAQEIPSTGVECWYKLGGRSQRSTIQGRIHLKLWLSTREDLGTSEEDNWNEIKQQENLHCIFIDFEVARFKVRAVPS